MSRGCYSGSHTIVRADGSFSSYDPAESRYEPIRKNNRTKSAKNAVKQVKPLSLGAQRKSLLNIAADACVLNRKLGLKFPKNIGDEVQQDVARVGTIEAWASKQDGFNELVKNKLQKKQERERRKDRAATSKPLKNFVKRTRTFHKQEPDPKRIALLKREIAQAQEFIRCAEKEIRRLQGDEYQS